MPENFQITKTSIWQLSDDAPNSADGMRPNWKIQEYFSISADKRPLRTELLAEDLTHNDEELVDEDYIELSDEIKNLAKN